MFSSWSLTVAGCVASGLMRSAPAAAEAIAEQAWGMSLAALGIGGAKMVQLQRSQRLLAQDLRMLAQS